MASGGAKSICSKLDGVAFKCCKSDDDDVGKSHLCKRLSFRRSRDVRVKGLVMEFLDTKYTLESMNRVEMHATGRMK